MRIGLSKTIINHNDIMYDCIEHAWYKLLAGHNLFVVPNTMNQTFDKIANDLDSFIITGGKDDTLREQVESHLANKMLERDKPVFGVGRGALLLAKILKADIIDVKNHTNCEHPIFYRREVRTVNSNHDTTIQQMSPGTDVLCHDYKGNIEAFINGNLAGILWNPESMTEPWIPPEIAYLLKI